MSKYTPLLKYLKEKEMNREFDIMLTFNKIEEIINSKLPNSARAHRNWWANGTTRLKPWQKVKWETYDVNISAGQVNFRR